MTKPRGGSDSTRGAVISTVEADHPENPANPDKEKPARNPDGEGRQPPRVLSRSRSVLQGDGKVMTKIACVAAVVVVCTTVSSVAADFDTETETAQTKMQQMKTEMHQLKMKMHLLQMKMQQIKMGETKTPKMKTPETPETKTPETKTPEMKAPEPKNPWDIAFGGALMSDFNFRGIAASDRRPAVTAYLEPRYNFTNSLQAYANIATYSLTLPNRVAAVVEMYGGVRPTFGRLGFGNTGCRVAGASILKRPVDVVFPRRQCFT